MGFLRDIFEGATSGTIKGTFEGIGSLAKDLRSAITGEISPEKKVELQQKLLELEAMASSGQVEVNKIEAAHSSVFVSGWRPALGWICGIALGVYFIPQYIMASIIWVKLSWAAQTLVAFPIGEPHGLLELVLGMLGLGALRTIEKIGGTARS